MKKCFQDNNCRILLGPAEEENLPAEETMIEGDGNDPGIHLK
jgi:hypothetical protein